MHTIGYLSLNCSLLLYLLWFLPQIYQNFKSKSIHFSHGMHYLLLLGYLMDVLYGFGFHMQWQYRLVTLVGLVSLLIQHAQMIKYGLHSKKERSVFICFSCLFVFLSIWITYILHYSPMTKEGYHLAGMITNICWLTFVLPQIIANAKTQTVGGLSTLFIWFTFILFILDGTSAWCLQWEYPSKIGNAISGVKKCILIYQWYQYHYKLKSKLV